MFLPLNFRNDAFGTLIGSSCSRLFGVQEHLNFSLFSVAFVREPQFCVRLHLFVPKWLMLVCPTSFDISFALPLNCNLRFRQFVWYCVLSVLSVVLKHDLVLFAGRVRGEGDQNPAKAKKAEYQSGPLLLCCRLSHNQNAADLAKLRLLVVSPCCVDCNNLWCFW